MDKHTLEGGTFPTAPSLCRCYVSTRNKELLSAFFWSVREEPAFAECPHPYLTRDISGVLMA